MVMSLFDLDLIKSLIIILVVILYWKFIYYKYHTKPITPILFAIFGLILASVGFYYWFFKKIVLFKEIQPVGYILLLFITLSFIFILIGIKKHGLNPRLDITLSWVDKNFGRIFVYLTMIGTYPVLIFTMFTTFVLLGKEYIVFWIMIFIAWTISGIKVLRYLIK